MEELLNFGRMETGAMRYRRGPLDPAEAGRERLYRFVSRFAGCKNFFVASDVL